jgi:hypothetical protein
MAHIASHDTVMAHVDPDLKSGNPLVPPTQWIDPQEHSKRKAETTAAVKDGLHAVVDQVRNPFARGGLEPERPRDGQPQAQENKSQPSQRFGTGLTAAIYGSGGSLTGQPVRHSDDGYITPIAVPHLSKLVTPYDGGNGKATLSEVAFARYLDGYRRARLQYPGAKMRIIDGIQGPALSLISGLARARFGVDGELLTDAQVLDVVAYELRAQASDSFLRRLADVPFVEPEDPIGVKKLNSIVNSGTMDFDSVCVSLDLAWGYMKRCADVADLIGCKASDDALPALFPRDNLPGAFTVFLKGMLFGEHLWKRCGTSDRDEVRRQKTFHDATSSFLLILERRYRAAKVAADDLSANMGGKTAVQDYFDQARKAAPKRAEPDHKGDYKHIERRTDLHAVYGDEDSEDVFGSFKRPPSRVQPRTPEEPMSIPSDFLGLFASEKEESPVLIESKDDPSFHGVPMHLAVAIQARGICHRKTFYGTCPDEGLKNERNELKCRWSLKCLEHVDNSNP